MHVFGRAVANGLILFFSVIVAEVPPKNKYCTQILIIDIKNIFHQYYYFYMTPQKVLLIVLFWAISTNYRVAISVTNMSCKRYIFIK